MSKQQIKTIQNLLKIQKRFDLAVKFENADLKHFDIEDDRYSIGAVILYVNPIHFFDLNQLNKKDTELILIILRALNLPYGYIAHFSVAINENIPQSTISDVVYIFVDEAGDMDFSPKGSKYYMFNFLVKTRPFQLHEYIANYRYELIERNLDPLVKDILDIEKFHACEDNRYIRRRMFEIIGTFAKEAVQVYAYILEKSKVNPDKRKENHIFFADNLAYAITQLLDKININRDFIIITDSLPVKSKKERQVGALKKGIKAYLKANKLGSRYTIHHHCSASSSNLQIIDYVGWAIYRKYEHGDPSYYELIKWYLLEEEVMTKDRKEAHY